MRLHLQARLFDNLIGKVHLGEDELDLLVDLLRLPFFSHLDLQDSLEAAALVLKPMLCILGRNIKAPVLHTPALIRRMGRHTKLGLGTAV